MAKGFTEQLVEIAENMPKVYEAGQQAELNAFWDMIQHNGTRTNYNYAFAGTSFDVELMKPKYYPIVPTTATSMFMHNTRGYPGMRDYSGICKMIDLSQITNATSIFQNICGKNLTVDLSNCTNATNAFNCNSGGSIDNLTLKVTEKLTSASQMFLYNSSLTTLTFTDDSVIAVDLTLQRCISLTLESLKSVIRALKDFSGTEQAFTHKISLAGESKELLEADGNTAPNGDTWLNYISAKGWNT